MEFGHFFEIKVLGTNFIFLSFSIFKITFSFLLKFSQIGKLSDIKKKRQVRTSGVVLHGFRVSRKQIQKNN